MIVIEEGSFRDCEAVVGGAIFFAADSVAEVRGVRFEDNYAEFHGGAIFSRGTGLSVSDCTFLRNRSEGNSVEGFGGGGGAIEVDAFSHVNFRMENCHLEGNCARQGGGLSIENIQESGNSQAVVSGCVFISNRATVAGGGVYTEHRSDRVEFRDCRFERNSASKGGGLYCSYGGETEVHGSVFHGNYAVHGGGVCCEESNTGLFNSTIVGNAAGNSGGGVYVISDDSRLTLTSSILWGNAGGSLRGDICAPGNVCSVTYCCIEDSMVWPGDGNINSSPLFAAWGEAGEVWVDAASPGPGNGSEADAYQSLKQALSGFSVALASSSPCLGGGQGGTNMGAEGEVVEGSGAPTRLVHLATGTYEFLDFTLTHTVSIEGRGPSETTLVGSVIGLRTGAALSRLSVTGAPSWGGVVVAEGESPAIRQVRISGNASSRDEENPLQGGGLYCYGSSPTVTNCLIAGNWSGSGGGAVYCREGAAPAVTNCTVVANGGSGVCSTNASPVLLNSIVSNHAAGSIVADEGSFPQVTYSLIEGDAVWPGEGNVSSAPLFVRDGVFDLEHFLPPEGDLCAVSPPDFIVDPGDYHLQEASPAIDAGTVDGAPAADIDGDQRPCGAAVDMGADETGDCVGFRFVRRDCNDDGEVNISDAVSILNWLFGGNAAVGCVAALNTNGDAGVNITDAVSLLNFLFAGGASPVDPFPDCGPGMLPADTELGCANPPNCQ